MDDDKCDRKAVIEGEGLLTYVGTHQIIRVGDWVDCPDGIGKVIYLRSKYNFVRVHIPEIHKYENVGNSYSPAVLNVTNAPAMDTWSN